MSLDTLETFPGGTERVALGSLSRASLVYSLGGLAYKGVALLTIPILARLLTPAQLGLLDLAAVLATLIGLLAVLGTDQAVAYFEPRTDDVGALWGSALGIVGVVGAVLGLGAILARGPLAEGLTGSAANAPIVAAAGLYGAIIGLTVTGLNAARLRATPVAYAMASFVLVAAEMSLALAIAWLGAGTVALVVVGWASGALVVLVLVLLRFLPRLRSPRAQTVRMLATYGAPLVPAAIGWLAGDAMIRGALAREVGVASLGEYGIAYRVASVLGLAVTGFGVAWYPYLYRSPAAAVAPRAAQALGLLVLLLAGIGVALTALSPEIIAIVAGPDYAGASAAVAPLVGGMVGLGAFILIGAVSGATGSTRRVALAALGGVAVQVIISLLLVPALGLVGAALSSLVGYVAAAVLLGATEPSVLIGRDWRRNLVILVIGVSGLATANAVTSASLVIRLGLVIGFALAAVVIARALRLEMGMRDVAA